MWCEPPDNPREDNASTLVFGSSGRCLTTTGTACDSDGWVKKLAIVQSITEFRVKILG